MAWNHQQVDFHQKACDLNITNILGIKCAHMGGFPKFGHI